MSEYTLNRLTTEQLAELAFRSATFLATVTRSAAKMELYYLDGHFIEVNYCVDTLSEQLGLWQLYSANHFPNDPSSAKYLTIYLQQIELVVD